MGAALSRPHNAERKFTVHMRTLLMHIMKLLKNYFEKLSNRFPITKKIAGIRISRRWQAPGAVKKRKKNRKKI